MPPEFEIPIRIGIRTLWELWYYGNSNYVYMGGKNICPYRIISLNIDLKLKNCRKNFSAACKVMGKIEEIGQRLLVTIYPTRAGQQYIALATIVVIFYNTHYCTRINYFNNNTHYCNSIAIYCQYLYIIYIYNNKYQISRFQKSNLINIICFSITRSTQISKHFIKNSRIVPKLSVEFQE